MDPNNRSRDRRSRAASRRAVALRGGGFTLAKQRDPESIRGFTLVELLIATGITVAIVLMLGLMLSSLMSTASHATQRVDAFRDARAALQVMERDLSNLVRSQWSPDPFTNPAPAPCAASMISTSRVTLPAAYFALDNLYPDPAAGNQQLYALVAEQTAASSGDLCAVGYYCAWDTQLHAYSLRRFFRALAVSDLQGFGTYAGESVLYTPGSSDPVLAAYVWNFQITLYDAAGNRYTPPSCVCDSAASTPIMLPAAVEISFNAMSPQAARTVMSVTAGMTDSAAAAYWMNMDANLVAPHTYQFRSRINLP
jgi:type II secretory pathway pseudopilin PulG